MVKALNFVISLIATAVVLCSDSSYSLAFFAPWMLPAGLGLAGGLIDAFTAEDADYYTEDDLIKKGWYKRPDFAKMKLDLARQFAGARKERRQNEQAKSMAYTGESIKPSYQNEEDLSFALQRGYSSVDEMELQEKQRISDMLLSYNLGQPKAQSPVSAFFSGALGGANLGMQLGENLGMWGENKTKDEPLDTDKDSPDNGGNLPKNNPTVNFPEIANIPEPWKPLFMPKAGEYLAKLPQGTSLSPSSDGTWGPGDLMYFLHGFNHKIKK